MARRTAIRGAERRRVAHSSATEDRRERAKTRIRWILLPLFLLALTPLALTPSLSGGLRSNERVEPSPNGPGEPPPATSPTSSPIASAESHEPPARAAVAPSSPGAEADAPPFSAATLSPPHAGETAARIELFVHEPGSDRPVPGARVELGLTAPDCFEERISLHEADAAGVLRLELEPGSLRLVAWSGRSAGGPLVHELAPGADARLRLELAPTHRVAGRIVDQETGEPVPGATVAFWTFAERDVARTGADGTFLHPRFPSGARTHQVRVEAPHHGSAVRYLEISADGTWHVPAACAAGEDVRGKGDPWVEIALPPALQVTGRVVDPDGRPIAGALVAAEGFFRVLPTVASRDESATHTGPDGRFLLEGLRADIGHSVFVRAPGFAELAVDVETGEDGVLGDLRVAGESLLAGVVVDPDGLPVEGALVVLYPGDADAAAAGTNAPSAFGDHGADRDGDRNDDTEALDVGVRVRGTEYRTRTSAAGTFLFENLVAASCRVEVVREGETLAAEDLQPLAGGDFPDTVLRLSGDTLTLQGRAVFGGTPVAGAVIEISRRGPVVRVTTDSGGWFRAAGLGVSAPYELRVSWPGSRELPPATAVLVSWAFERPVLDLRQGSVAGPALARSDR